MEMKIQWERKFCLSFAGWKIVEEKGTGVGDLKMDENLEKQRNSDVTVYAKLSKKGMSA